jgi:hypothetical protein
MKKLIYFLLAISIFSCKKYEEDSFFSTYTVEKRLINSSSNMWTLEKFSSTSVSEKSINENNFNLFFSKDSVIFSTLNNEYVGFTGWSFDSEKKYISLKNGQKFEILQLEVDKLKLKNEQGDIYSFKKKLNQEYVTVSDESIFNVPLFGLSSSSSILKLTDVNHCEQNNISVNINGSISSNPLVTGLLENGFGFTGSLNSISLNFSKYYSKPGELSFYYKKEAWNTYNLVIKINGVQASYTEGADLDTGWGFVKVNVPNTGNLNFSIQSTKSTGIVAIEAFDEIKFWEYH